MSGSVRPLEGQVVTGDVRPATAGALPAIIITNLVPIGGSGIVARFDMTITKWRFRFARCLWRRRDDREWISFACDCGEFFNHGDRKRFQEAALTAVREAAREDAE
jgi:hypothetical protein